MARQLKPEESFLTAVLDLAKVRHWFRLHIRPARRANGGWLTPVQGEGEGLPDLLLLRPPRMVIAELKVPPNKTTPAQQAWLEAFRGVPGVEVHEWTPAEWNVIQETLA